jgi:hypothetical protein
MLASQVREYYGGIEPSVEQIIGYLVRHNVIRQSIINRYMVVNLYPDTREKEGGKEKAVWSLSNRLPLEPKAIYHILSNHYCYFAPNRFRYP